MRKTERLLQLLNLLQGRRTVITARHMAEHLGVSERTIYRDIQSLCLSGIPVEGEAGVGYRLRRGYEIPPLMFTTEELETLVLGARMVQAWTDKRMAASAQQAMVKIAAVLPDNLKHLLDNKQMLVPDFHINSQVAYHLESIRSAIKQRHILNILYQRLDGEISERHIHPLGLFYWGHIWTLAAWCLLRDSLRTFRVDRIQHLHNTQQQFHPQRGQTLDDYLNQACKEEHNNENKDPLPMGQQC